MNQCLDIITHSSVETHELGYKLGILARPGDLILLDGELGAGKTTITQGIAKGMGFGGYVHSPTCVLVHEYVGITTLYHLDLYRLGTRLEFDELGFEEMLLSGVCVVEWAGRFPSVFPYDRLSIDLASVADGEFDTREVRIMPFGARSELILEQLKASVPSSSVVVDLKGKE